MSVDELTARLHEVLVLLAQARRGIVVALGLVDDAGTGFAAAVTGTSDADAAHAVGQFTQARDELTRPHEAVTRVENVVAAYLVSIGGPSDGLPTASVRPLDSADLRPSRPTQPSRPEVAGVQNRHGDRWHCAFPRARCSSPTTSK
jgi:hypothetical protein